MNMLVTGGAGYIGSHMVLELLGAAERVVVLDNLRTGFAWAVDNRATLVQGDIADRDLVRRIIAEHQVSAVIHFAGSVVVPESVADPLSYYHNNTAKSRTLIETALKAGVRQFIFSSTAAVYGDVRDMPVTEMTPLAPVSPYGASKLMTEIMLRDTAAAHDFRYVALRYFNVAGADPHGRTGQSTRGATHLIKVACEAALGKRRHMDIYGTDYDTVDGTCVRDYIHVSDLASAHMAALAYLRRGGTSDVFNCGYGHGYSVRQVIDTVRRVSGVGSAMDVRMAPRRPGDPPAIVAASDKIRATLGWQPARDNLEQIVADALAWEKGLDARLEALGRA
jgi:UDP-glucose 4-epimerase